MSRDVPPSAGGAFTVIGGDFINVVEAPVGTFTVNHDPLVDHQIVHGGPGVADHDQIVEFLIGRDNATSGNFAADSAATATAALASIVSGSGGILASGSVSSVIGSTRGAGGFMSAQNTNSVIIGSLASGGGNIENIGAQSVVIASQDEIAAALSITGDAVTVLSHQGPATVSVDHVFMAANLVDDVAGSMVVDAPAGAPSHSALIANKVEGEDTIMRITDGASATRDNSIIVASALVNRSGGALGAPMIIEHENQTVFGPFNAGAIQGCEAVSNGGNDNGGSIIRNAASRSGIYHSKAEWGGLVETANFASSSMICASQTLRQASAPQVGPIGIIRTDGSGAMICSTLVMADSEVTARANLSFLAGIMTGNFAIDDTAGDIGTYGLGQGLVAIGLSSTVGSSGEMSSNGDNAYMIGNQITGTSDLRIGSTADFLNDTRQCGIVGCLAGGGGDIVVDVGTSNCAIMQSNAFAGGSISINQGALFGITEFSNVVQGWNATAAVSISQSDGSAILFGSGAASILDSDDSVILASPAGSTIDDVDGGAIIGVTGGNVSGAAPTFNSVVMAGVGTSITDTDDAVALSGGVLAGAPAESFAHGTPGFVAGTLVGFRGAAPAPATSITALGAPAGVDAAIIAAITACLTAHGFAF